jgi:thiamine-phosphate pyrophosphorylase
MAPMRGLYPIVDLDTLERRKIEPLLLADAVLTAHPALLQLRAKHQAPKVVLELLEQLAPRCRAAGTELFANDRPDLALLSGASGVHVGQDDLPLEAVRRLDRSGGSWGPNLAPLRVGVSTHNEAQLVAALAQAPDYVAFGPIFGTLSKERADPALGLGAVARAAELAAGAGIPLVVIGGLTLAVAGELAKFGVVAAVISDLLADGASADVIAARAQAWQRALTS